MTAIPTRTRHCAITIPAAQVGSGGVTAFPVYLDETCFVGGADHDIWANAQDGGGDLVFSSDEAGQNRIGLEVVTFNTSTKKCELHFPASLSSSLVNKLHCWYKGGGSEVQPDAAAAFGAESVWGSSFMLVWHMADLTTSTVHDSTANHRDGAKGSANNPLGTASGILGGAQVFTAASSHYISTSCTPPNGACAITMSLKDGVASNGYAAFSDAATPAATHDRTVGITNTGLVFAYCYNGGVKIAAGGSDITGATPHRIGMLIDTTNGLYAITDGVKGTPSATGTNGYNAYSTPYFLVGWGNYASSSTAYGSGTMDEVRLFNITPSQAYLTTEKNNLNDPDAFASVGAGELAMICRPWQQRRNRRNAGVI